MVAICTDLYAALNRINHGMLSHQIMQDGMVGLALSGEITRQYCFTLTTPQLILFNVIMFPLDEIKTQFHIAFTINAEELPSHVLIILR